LGKHAQGPPSGKGAIIMTNVLISRNLPYPQMDTPLPCPRCGAKVLHFEIVTLPDGVIQRMCAACRDKLPSHPEARRLWVAYHSNPGTPAFKALMSGKDTPHVQETTAGPVEAKPQGSNGASGSSVGIDQNATPTRREVDIVQAETERPPLTSFQRPEPAAEVDYWRIHSAPYPPAKLTPGNIGTPYISPRDCLFSCYRRDWHKHGEAFRPALRFLMDWQTSGGETWQAYRFLVLRIELLAYWALLHQQTRGGKVIDFVSARAEIERRREAEKKAKDKRKAAKAARKRNRRRAA
jgi:hypothetical protein